MSGVGAERSEPARRSTYVEHAVVYAAVGATAEPDLMRFPPEGSTPYEAEQRLGSGSDRFLMASSLLMTWGAQRGIGAELVEIEQGDGGEYSGVTFDEHGTPQPNADQDIEYGPDGEPFLNAGTTVLVRWADNRAQRRMRVVYTVSEARRVGYAWGTADSEGAVGEEIFVVEHRDDDTVWATVRGFVWATEPGLLGLKGKSAVRAAIKGATALLAALAPGAVPGETLEGGVSSADAVGEGADEQDPVGEHAVDEADVDEPGVDEPGVDEPGVDEPGVDDGASANRGTENRVTEDDLADPAPVGSEATDDEDPGEVGVESEAEVEIEAEAETGFDYGEQVETDDPDDTEEGETAVDAAPSTARAVRRQPRRLSKAQRAKLHRPRGV